VSTGDRFGVATGDWLGVVVTVDRFGACGDHRWFKRSTGKKSPVTRNVHIV